MANRFSSADEITQMGQAFAGLKGRIKDRKINEQSEALKLERENFEPQALKDTRLYENMPEAPESLGKLDELSQKRLAFQKDKYGATGGLDTKKLQGVLPEARAKYESFVREDRELYNQRKTQDLANAFTNYKMTNDPNMIVDVANGYGFAAQLGIPDGIKSIDFDEQKGSYTIVPNGKVDPKFKKHLTGISPERLEQYAMGMTNPEVFTQIQNVMATVPAEARATSLAIHAEIKAAFGGRFPTPEELQAKFESDRFFRYSINAATKMTWTPETITAFPQYLTNQGLPVVAAAYNEGTVKPLGYAALTAKEQAEENKRTAQTETQLQNLFNNVDKEQKDMLLKVTKEGQLLGVVASTDQGFEPTFVPGEVYAEIEREILATKAMLANATGKEKTTLNNKLNQLARYKTEVDDAVDRVQSSTTAKDNIIKAQAKRLEDAGLPGLLPNKRGLSLNSPADMPLNTTAIDKATEDKMSNASTAAILGPKSLVGRMAFDNAVQPNIPAPQTDLTPGAYTTGTSVLNSNELRKLAEQLKNPSPNISR